VSKPLARCARENSMTTMKTAGHHGPLQRLSCAPLFHAFIMVFMRFSRA
jgi:hypothetical protein